MWGGANMVIEPQMTRRWRLYDAILLIAATAVAMAPARLLAPEMIPVVRKLELIRLFDYAYVQDLFARKMSSGRMESIRLQFQGMVDAFMGANKQRVRLTDHRTGQLESPEKGLEHWVLYHTNHGRALRPGIPLAGSALGFALAQDGFYLVFPFLLLWSFCLMILRLIPPRPGWASHLPPTGVVGLLRVVARGCRGVDGGEHYCVAGPVTHRPGHGHGGVAGAGPESAMGVGSVVDRSGRTTRGPLLARDDPGLPRRVRLLPPDLKPFGAIPLAPLRREKRSRRGRDGPASRCRAILGDRR